MKKLVYLLLLVFPVFFYGQQVIAVSEQGVSVIIMPEEIDDYYLGNEVEYFIKKNNSNSQLSKRTLGIGYLKIKNDKGKFVLKDTNLIVLTKSGNSYEFSLKYKQNPAQYKHTVTPIAIGREERLLPPLNKKPKAAQIIETPSSYYSDNISTVGDDKKGSPTLYDAAKLIAIRKICKASLYTKKVIFKTYSKVSNVKLSLKSIAYDKSEIYFYFNLKNKGGLAFDLDHITFELGNTIKNNVQQNIMLKPVMIYEKPLKVEGKGDSHFVVVFEKFTINENKKLEINLAEKEGERDLLLKVSHTIINNPKPIKL